MNNRKKKAVAERVAFFLGKGTRNVVDYGCGLFVGLIDSSNNYQMSPVIRHSPLALPFLIRAVEAVTLSQVFKRIKDDPKLRQAYERRYQQTIGRETPSPEDREMLDQGLERVINQKGLPTALKRTAIKTGAGYVIGYLLGSYLSNLT